MKELVSFELYGTKYIFFENNGKICLSKIINGEILKIDENDKLRLKKIILILSEENFNINEFANQNVTLLQTNQNILNNPIENFIQISFSEGKDIIFLNNCHKLYSTNNFTNVQKNKKTNKVFIGTFIVMSIIIVVLLLIPNVNINTINNQAILDKYTYILPDDEVNVLNVKVETKKIVNVKSELNFNNKFVSFNLPNNTYEFDIEQHYANVTTDLLYNSPTGEELETAYTIGEFTNLSDFENRFNNFKEKYSELSIEDFLKRNNINNRMDFIYNSVLNINKKVNKKSSKEEIIDKFILDYFMADMVPSTNVYYDKIILLNGDKYGYIAISDDIINISLKYNNDEISIYISNREGKISLTEEEIINIVSTMQFNI